MTEEFYIVMKSPHGSDYALFWRPDRQGYTHILHKAGRYSKEEATKICKLRGEEFMVPCNVVVPMGITVVDHSQLMIFSGEN